MIEKCPECGAPGGRAACQQMFDEVLAREFGDALYFSVHRTTVDCYALQHDAYIASFKSFAAHLVGLYVALELDSDPQALRAIHLGLDGKIERARPPIPESRGELTIESVHRIVGVEQHRIAVRAWAASVWKAWSSHHDLARQLLEEMRKSAGARKPAAR